MENFGEWQPASVTPSEILNKIINLKTKKMKPKTVSLKQLTYPDHCINGRMLLPSVSEGDVRNVIISHLALNEWKDKFREKFTNCNIIIDESQPWFYQFRVIDCPAFNEWKKRDIDGKAAFLKQFGTTE